MFHVLAFTLNTGAGLTNQDAPGVTDGYATLQNSHYVINQDVQVRAAYAQGATLSRARINTPALRQISLPSIVPVEVAATPSDYPALCEYDPFMPILKAIDEIAVEVSNSGGVADREIAGLWVQPIGGRPAQQGPTFTVRCTAAITTGNLTWGAGALVFDQTLPAGRYQVVGMDLIGANAIFARLRFSDQTMLPGCLARATIAATPRDTFRMGKFGAFGEFVTQSAPTLEGFGSAALTTQEIYLDLVRVG